MNTRSHLRSTLLGLSILLALGCAGKKGDRITMKLIPVEFVNNGPLDVHMDDGSPVSTSVLTRVNVGTSRTETVAFGFDDDIDAETFVFGVARPEGQLGTGELLMSLPTADATTKVTVTWDGAHVTVVRS